MAKRLVGVNEQGIRVGEDHQRATLTDADVELMRQLREEDSQHWTYDALAEKFDVSRRHARDIVNYRKRVAAPVAWRAVE